MDFVMVPPVCMLRMGREYAWDCWCRGCTRRKVPGPYGWHGPALAQPVVRACCRDAWVARGWFCRWCGRDSYSGWQETARGIYGGLHKDWEDMPDHCACGSRLRSWQNYAACGGCYWVITIQIVRRFHNLFRGWSEIQELIFMCLIDSALCCQTDSEEATYREQDLQDVRRYGLQLGNSLQASIRTYSWRDVAGLPPPIWSSQTISAPGSYGGSSCGRPSRSRAAAAIGSQSVHKRS